MAQKRTLDSFFSAAKKPKLSPDNEARQPSAANPEPIPVISTDSPSPSFQNNDISLLPSSTHPAYPIPIRQLPPSLLSDLSNCPSSPGKSITNAPDLDLLYFSPFIPFSVSQSLFHFLRRSMPFYRVKYTIKRGSTETEINTPRYTTVFGVDATARFNEDESGSLVSAASKSTLPASTYSCRPRPLPQCLNALRVLTEAATGATYNFCLVNYYASGADSISYHSDDEKFLGKDPAIASFSLGARRDFLMKHKPAPNDSAQLGAQETIKFPLASGDMVLMRGRTQSYWLHSIPKRKGDAQGGRINITFRKVLVRGGTENYYKYNVGDGEVFRWDDKKKEMVSSKD